MTGFYSKDFILESAYGQFTFSGVAVYIIATIGAIFTTLYSVKVLYLTFLTNPNGPRIYYKLAHEGDLFLILPLVILAIFSIFFGFITKDIFIGLGSDFFVDNSLFIHPIHEIMIDTEFAVPRIIKLIPFIFTVSFIIIAFNISELLPKLVINFKLKRLGYNIYGFFNQRALFEYLCITILVQKILYIGKKFIIYIDQGFLEPLGFIGKLILQLSLDIAKFSAKTLIFYSLVFLASFVIYIFILSFNIYPLVVMNFPANLVALNLIFAVMVVFVIKNNYAFESLSKQKAVLNSRCLPTREGNSMIEFNNSLSYQGQPFNNLLSYEGQPLNNLLSNNDESKKFLLDSSVEIVNKEIRTSNLIESTFSSPSFKPSSNLLESTSSSIELSSLNWKLIYKLDKYNLMENFSYLNLKNFSYSNSKNITFPSDNIFEFEFYYPHILNKLSSIASAAVSNSSNYVNFLDKHPYIIKQPLSGFDILFEFFLELLKYDFFKITFTIILYFILKNLFYLICNLFNIIINKLPLPTIHENEETKTFKDRVDLSRDKLNENGWWNVSEEELNTSTPLSGNSGEGDDGDKDKDLNRFLSTALGERFRSILKELKKGVRIIIFYIDNLMGSIDELCVVLMYSNLTNIYHTNSFRSYYNDFQAMLREGISQINQHIEMLRNEIIYYNVSDNSLLALFLSLEEGYEILYDNVNHVFINVFDTINLVANPHNLNSTRTATDDVVDLLNILSELKQWFFDFLSILNVLI